VCRGPYALYVAWQVKTSHCFVLVLETCFHCVTKLATNKPFAIN
jgi:hypothetical protein